MSTRLPSWRLSYGPAVDSVPTKPKKNKERKKIKINSHTTVVPSVAQNKKEKEKLTDFVKVKRVISRDGTVESRLEERRPAVAELVGSASIRFANAGDPRVHRL